MSWIIGGDYDNWLTTEPEDECIDDDPYEDDKVEAYMERMEEE